MQLLKLVEPGIQMDVPPPWNVRNHDCTLLLARGHVVSSEAQMLALLERGMYVDLEEKRAVEALSAPKPAPPKSIYVRWTDAIDTLETLVHDLPHAPDFPAKIGALAQELITLADLDADIAIFMAVRQDQARHLRYGYSHSIYTALLAILMAQRMEWAAANIRLVTLAALTMNASIADLQGQMANQDYPVLDRQRAQLRTHPIDSAALLAKAGITDAPWLEAVRQHHEQASGKGYPTGTTQINELAQMLRMADIFMARISPRGIRPPMSVQDAARQMFRDDKGGADVVRHHQGARHLPSRQSCETRVRRTGRGDAPSCRSPYAPSDSRYRRTGTKRHHHPASQHRRDHLCHHRPRSR